MPLPIANPQSTIDNPQSIALGLGTWHIIAQCPMPGDADADADAHLAHYPLDTGLQAGRA
jgi:hypothetical protein